MTTQTEALKMALKDLKWVDNWLCEKPMSECVTKLRKAITAIKEALSSPNGEAQPEQRSVSEHLKERSSDEPVPDLYVKDINGNFHSYKEKGHTVSSQCVPPSLVGVGEDDFTPQSKPMTDEQIQYAFRTNSVVIDDGNAYMVAGKRAINIARAIEAAHGIMSDTDGKE